MGMCASVGGDGGGGSSSLGLRRYIDSGSGGDGCLVSVATVLVDTTDTGEVDTMNLLSTIAIPAKSTIIKSICIPSRIVAKRLYISKLSSKNKPNSVSMVSFFTECTQPYDNEFHLYNQLTIVLIIVSVVISGALFYRSVVRYNECHVD